LTHAATPPRRAALRVLRAVRGGELLDRALGVELPRLEPRDRAWTQELVYGTLRLRGRLDHALGRQLSRPLDAVDVDVLEVLRLGAYQLLEMASVPAYAAVSQSVELARWAGAAKAAGFVNGVLNGLRRGAAGLTFPSFEEDAVAHLTTWGSHPRWLVERWIGCFGVDAARRIVEANNRRPALYLRTAGPAVETLQAVLAEGGIETERLDFAPDALRLVTAERLGDALAASAVIVQDPAAGLVVRAARPRAGDRVVDVCAAPGGKAIALAAGTGAGVPAVVVAADVSAARLARLAANVARLHGVQGTGVRRRAPIELVVADARTPPLRAAELVLIDAPCTGTGTLRRHPDGRWRIGPADLAALAALQAELLEAAAPIVAPGGVLVYATCSIEAEENGRQVETFLDRHPEFEEEPVTGVDRRALDGAGRLAVLPHVFGVDGAFAARLRRRAA
jgi:16S rRNA (cytosine967-C5)-methyltransferase